MLSFFRDAACPFCNFRIYELTHKYKSWQQDGLEVSQHRATYAVGGITPLSGVALSEARLAS